MKKKWIIAIVAIVAVLLLASYATIVLADKKKSSPKISKIYTDPVDVKPGDLMLISADIKDKVGIKSVQVFIFYEGGFDPFHEKNGDKEVDVLNLNLVSGDEFKGTWQVVWDVYGTVHTTIIRAENENGIISAKDPYGNDYFVILNSVTGLSCNTLCVSGGYDLCISAGTDAGGTNLTFATEFGCEGGVMNGATNACAFEPWSDGGECEGNATQWTNCLCKKLQGQKPPKK